MIIANEVHSAELMGTLSRDDGDVDENGPKLHSRFLNKFAMIYTHLVCEMWPNYPGANVVGAALKFRKRNGNLSSWVHVDLYQIQPEIWPFHVVVLQRPERNARAEPVFC